MSSEVLVRTKYCSYLHYLKHQKIINSEVSQNKIPEKNGANNYLVGLSDNTLK